MNLKIVSWNVASIRTLPNKIDINQFLKENNIDIFCISETKLSCKVLDDFTKKFKETIEDYEYRYYNCSTIKKGYSGTAIWSKIKPISIKKGIGIEKYSKEGRVITIELDKFYLINVYTPNSGDVLQRLNYRVKEWDLEFRKYIKKLQKTKPVIIAGDLNCAHKEIDIHNPKLTNSAGFTKEERESFEILLKENNLIDSFRLFYPNKKNVFTYWSYRGRARPRNKGWRIDYFLVDKKLKNKVIKSEIITKKDMNNFYLKKNTKKSDSDHAPIELILKI